MARAFVTGATGFVGSALASALLDRGHEVVALRRSTSVTDRLARLPVNWAEADLTDAAALARAFDGCDVVFHVAGAISYRPEDRDELVRTNVLGTRAVAEACRRARVPRLVHTSSISACAHTLDGTPQDESAPWNSAELRIDYFTTKHLAEVEVLQACASGLDAVIVNPGSIFGAESRGNTERFLLRLRDGRIPFVPRGGTTCIGVRDAVEGHLAAWTRGRRGERYVLGSENLTWAQVLGIAAAEMTVPPPRHEAGRAIMSTLAVLLDGVSALGISTGGVSGPGLRALSVFLFFDGAKASRDLGFSPAPMRRVLRETVDGLRARGLVRVPG